MPDTANDLGAVIRNELDAMIREGTVAQDQDGRYRLTDVGLAYVRARGLEREPGQPEGTLCAPSGSFCLVHDACVGAPTPGVPSNNANCP